MVTNQVALVVLFRSLFISPISTTQKPQAIFRPEKVLEQILTEDGVRKFGSTRVGGVWKFYKFFVGLLDSLIYAV